MQSCGSGVSNLGNAIQFGFYTNDIYNAGSSMVNNKKGGKQ